ncbi:hypothetical protein [Kingella negevensis]|nr:hypothetical protein [Kingella negevensis]MDK4691794.1 hypothetical protein [Kingella negevensis]
MIHSFLFLAIFLTACQPENTSAPQSKNVPVIPYEKWQQADWDKFFTPKYQGKEPEMGESSVVYLPLATQYPKNDCVILTYDYSDDGAKVMLLTSLSILKAYENFKLAEMKKEYPTEASAAEHGLTLEDVIPDIAKMMKQLKPAHNNQFGCQYIFSLSDTGFASRLIYQSNYSLWDEKAQKFADSVSVFFESSATG